MNFDYQGHIQRYCKHHLASLAISCNGIILYSMKLSSTDEQVSACPNPLLVLEDYMYDNYWLTMVAT